MNIVGYSDPLSVAPGDQIRFMVSARAASFRASLVRLAGAGGADTVESEIGGTHPGREQELRPGSCVIVEEAPPLDAGAGFTLEAWVWPTAPESGRQAIMSRYDGRRGYGLGIDELGRAVLWLDGDAAVTDDPLRARAWYRLEASYDPARRRARIAQEPLSEWPGAVTRRETELGVRGWSEPAVPFLLAAWGEPAAAHYNGKIEAPRLRGWDGSVLAAWNLGSDFASDRVEDVSGGGRHGHCVNLPMRAVTGRLWRGHTTTPALAPDEYAAIRFHDDDLEDAPWEPSFALRVPDDLPSGVYAARVEAEGGGEDEIPFFVRPPRGRRSADAVVLMPTLSYLAYGNEHNSWANPIPSTPGLRRGHAGTDVWRSGPGEVHHASTGEPGGLWRFRGRPPQRVAGIGFTAQGFDRSLPYRLAEGARDARAAWIFEGVENDEAGAHGSVLNGAAGFEIDRVDAELGTPPHALVLATARGFSDVYQATSEDILTSDSQQGGTVSPLVRADMVFYERPNGGAVFSTGSIAWCGALLDDDCDNDVSRITENVLRRFASKGPVN